MVEARCVSIPSDRHPLYCDDAFFINNTAGLYGVCDGVGGSSRGGEAARAAVRLIQEKGVSNVKCATAIQYAQRLRRIIQETNIEICRYLDGNGQTTASIVALWKSSHQKRIIIMNIGDSRVYSYTAADGLTLRTIDDAIALSGVDEQTARRVVEYVSDLTDEPAVSSDEEQHFFELALGLWSWGNVIRQCIGQTTIHHDPIPLVPRISYCEWVPLTTIIIMSDGIHDNLTTSQMRRILTKNGSTSQTCIELVAQARAVSRDKKNNRAKPDDMTALVIKIIE